MDCYYGSGLDDLVVPEDQEFSDRLPSPDSWSKWGISSPEVFDSAKKFTMDTNEMEEDLDLYDLSLSEEVELETSVYDKYQSSGSSVCGGFPEQFYAETDRSRDSPNHQLQYLGGFEQMDDIFLHSVFEDLHGPETSKKSFCYSPESNCGKMPRDNLLTNISVDSDMHDLESSKYLKTHDFSPPGGLQKEDVAAPQFVPCNTKKNDHLPEEASTFEVLAPFEKNIQGDSMHEESSFQQSALHELELVMAQFTEETRICFRDALYRLARNSKQQQIAEHQDGCCATQEAIPWTDHSETTRSGKEKEMELETNSIDRAVANLMFNKMEFKGQDLPLATSVNSKQEAIETPGQQTYSSNQGQNFHYPHSTNIPGDAEVPMFSQMDQQTTTDLSRKNLPERRSFVLQFGQ